MPFVFNERTGMFDEVPGNPQINSFSFDGTPIRYKDEVVNFVWDVVDAQHIFLNDVEISPGLSSYQYQLSEIGLQNFVLRIEDCGITKTASLQLNVLDTPVFDIEQSKDKLRKGKNESCLLKWDIKNIKSVKLLYNDVVQDILTPSELVVSPEVTTKYKFDVIGLDGIRNFSKTIHIDVFEEAIVTFEVDKNVSLPHIPVKLSWNVKNASDIELVDYGKVEPIGEQIVECDRETSFVLKVTDVFGTIEYKQHIRMYPLPLIKAIFVPTPKLEKIVKVETHMELRNIQVNLNVQYAKIPDFAGIKTNLYVPTIPFHQLEVTLKKTWWQKLQEYNENLIKQIKTKISLLWHS